MHSHYLGCNFIWMYQQFLWLLLEWVWARTLTTSRRCSRCWCGPSVAWSHVGPSTNSASSATPFAFLWWQHHNDAAWQTTTKMMQSVPALDPKILIPSKVLYPSTPQAFLFALFPYLLLLSCTLHLAIITPRPCKIVPHTRPSHGL